MLWSLAFVTRTLRRTTGKFREAREYRPHRLRQGDPVSHDFWARLHPSLRVGYSLALTLFVTIWLLCTIFTIWAGSSLPLQPGLVVTLSTGSCSALRRSNFWLHLLINAIASGAYATSSYIMQRLAAPTRAEIDNAHEHQTQLKIGSLALTNFASLNKKKLIIFAIL